MNTTTRVGGRASYGNKNPSEANDKDEANRRKRRRVLSCESCRRLKCRCDFDPVSQICHRCRTLRVACSLNTGSNQILTSPTIATEERDIEERFCRYEKSLSEIKAMVQDICTRMQVNKSTPGIEGGAVAHLSRGAPKPADSVEDTGAEDLLGPADKGINIAPAIVLRQLGSQLGGGYRRLFEHVNQNLLELGLLDIHLANKLVSQFFRSRSRTFPISSISDWASDNELHRVSPFLHAVCCLHSICFSKNVNIKGSGLHRAIYEHVRGMLGQVILASPLPLAEIFGILIMCLFSMSPTDGPEYIDSWLLSGQCAQQAMLSISFSDIMTRIETGLPTSADQKAIRLWANICLVHLQWAATTGRPPMIPNRYLSQCNILLEFHQATMQDGMLLAEIRLYSTLHQMHSQHSTLDSDGACDEFTSWKQKWAYLFNLPTSPVLMISYYAAYLILARRSLEEWREAPRGKLSKLPRHDDSYEIGDRTDVDDAVGLENTNLDRTSTDRLGAIQAHVLDFAISSIKTFLDMPSSLIEELPEFHHLCVTYSTLVVSQYDQGPSSQSEEETLALVDALQRRCAVNTDRISKVLNFAAEKAKEKLEVRIKANATGDQTLDNQSFPHRGSSGSPVTPQPVTAQTLGSVSLVGEISSKIWASTGTNDLQYDWPMFSLNMEEFFGGGFLDLADSGLFPS